MTVDDYCVLIYIGIFTWHVLACRLRQTEAMLPVVTQIKDLQRSKHEQSKKHISLLATYTTARVLYT